MSRSCWSLNRRPSLRPCGCVSTSSEPSWSTLGAGVWLHLLRWSRPDAVEALMRHAEQFDAVEKMHALMEDGEEIGRGGVVSAPRRAVNPGVDGNGDVWAGAPGRRTVSRRPDG
jgi:hypothetical protein